MDKDFTVFLEVWKTENYNRTELERDFCFIFKRQIIPTMVRLVKADSYKVGLERISQIPYDEQIVMVWEALYAEQ